MKKEGTRKVEEILEDFKWKKAAKERRKLHRELRHLGHPGLPLSDRYPILILLIFNLLVPLMVSILTALLTISAVNAIL